MKILVTGAGGFIGTRLVKSLLKKPGSEVHALLRNPEHCPRGAVPVVSDILDRNIDLSGYGLVYHLASISNPKLCDVERENAWRTNVDGTRNVLEAMKSGTKFIFMSSAHIYPNDGSIHGESDPAQPHSFYGLTKLVGEEMVRYYAKRSKSSYAVFRLFNSYAADQPHGFIVPDVIGKFKIGGKIEVVNPESLIDLVHVDDVVSVLSSAQALEGTYNICSGHRIRIAEVYRKIQEYVGASPQKTAMKGTSPPGLAGSNEKLRSLGFSFREFGLP